MEWSISKLQALRRCHRQFYFAYVLADYHFTFPARRKAYELAKSQNLKMWQGTLVDWALNNYVIPAYKQKEKPNFDEIARNTVEVARKQFEFSKNQLYRKNGNSKSKMGSEFQILDVHEWAVPFEAKDVEMSLSIIKEVLLRISDSPSPEAGKNLDEYLSESSFLRPNESRWSYEFAGVKIRPQIDLIRYRSKSIHVIDWKVSASNSSDYSKQLILAGVVALHNIKKNSVEKGWTLPTLSDVSLFEINLLSGNIKTHPFTKDSTGAVLDYVFLNSSDIFNLTENKKWNELKAEDFATTDKPQTCAFCRFRPLCVHLIQNGFIYDEQKYYQLVQNRELEGSEI